MILLSLIGLFFIYLLIKIAIKVFGFTITLSAEVIKFVAKLLVIIAVGCLLLMAV